MPKLVDRDRFPIIRTAISAFANGPGSIGILLLIGLFLCAGCSRRDYRLWADRDAYRLLNARQSDPLWQIPNRTVEPSPTSRLADACNQDCGPVPPDDPTAHCYMRHPYRGKNVKYWGRLGEAGEIDQQQWLDYLPYDESGNVNLTKQESVNLALNNSRQYQDAVNALYIAALGLSANRYDFALRWFGGNDTTFVATGDGAPRDLRSTNRLGFTRNLAAGGQLAVDLVNSFTWQFGGGANQNSAQGNLLIGLTQPLLRGAFQYVALETLTQNERTLLYLVREFASFRRQFYLDVVSQYLSLLNQSLRIRIEEENVQNLKRNLAEHEELLKRELVSPIQVDQVFQSYLSGRVSVLNAKQSFALTSDQFKFQLGLPARVPFKLDESILKQFQLNSPEIVQLQDQAEELEQSLFQYLPPEKAPPEFFERSYAELEQMATAVEKLKPGVEKELEQWLQQLEESKPTESTSEDDRLEHQQQETLATRVEEQLADLNKDIEDADQEIKKAKQRLENETRQESEHDPDPGQAAGDEKRSPAEELDLDQSSVEEEAWKTLQFLVSRKLQDQISTLFVAQTQIRLFLIEIKPVEIDEETAVRIALENRLDLMNSRAQVVDAFRAVEIAANNLRSDLDVSASADLRTDPNKKNVIRFDGNENIYSVGVQFDGPLDRMSERNAFRSAQIAYQQQRQSYMATEDSITNEVRQDLRQLISDKFDFQVSRQSLIAATRQVDEAQFSLRTATAGDSSLTLDLLLALQGLTTARNGLISSWISYEVSRIELFVDLELLMLDEQGVWINEQENAFTNALDSGGSTASDRNEFERAFNGELDDSRNFDDIADPEPSEPSLPLEPESGPAVEGSPVDKDLSDYFRPTRPFGDGHLGDQ